MQGVQSPLANVFMLVFLVALTAFNVRAILRRRGRVSVAQFKKNLTVMAPLFLFVAINLVLHEVLGRSTGLWWDLGGGVVVIMAILMLMLWQARFAR